MRLCDLGPDLTRRMLDHLGADEPALDADGLRTLHRAFLDRVPYENLQIRAGIPTALDPVQSAERIITGRGGYCYHLNGAFGSLLYGLGFPVRLAMGNPEPGDLASWGRHVLLLVDFPDQGRWLADVGIGDGFRDPLPLRPGTYRQGPFAYGIVESDPDPDSPQDPDQDLGSGPVPRARWQWRHDPLGSLRAFDLDPDSYDPRIVRRMHQFLSTDPDSPFIRTLTVQARRPEGALLLRGCVLTTVDADGKRSQDLDSDADWWSALAEKFGIRADGFDPDVRERLWKDTRTGHEAWIAAGRP